MSLPLLALPLEDLLRKAKISLWYKGFKRVGENELGMPIYGNEENWEASIIKPRHTSAEGPTPRDAVISLLKKIGAV